MGLNSISKQGIVIGAVTFVICLVIIVVKLPRVISMMTEHDDEYYYTWKYVWYRTAVMIVAPLAVIFSILMIVGIVKKRHMLLLPWLVVGLLSSVVASGTTLYDTMARTRFRVEDLFFLFVFIGLQVIILHPVYNLYLEIRRENTTAECKEFESNYTRNLQNACEKVSKMTRV